MKIFLIIIAAMCASCIHTDIHRMNSKERMITVYGAATKHRLWRHLKHRANAVGCVKLKDVVIVQWSYARGTCVGWKK